MEIFYIVFGIIIGLLFGIVIGKIIKYKELKKERLNSIKKSKSVILGEVYEKIIPFMPSFEYSPKDMIFVGKGIDYIIFDGLSNGDLKKIIFLEIKSGKSNLNKNEKDIKSAINQNKIFYQEYRIK